MSDIIQEKWQQLDKKEQKLFLKYVFFDILLSQENCVTFMTEEDWTSVMDETTMDISSYRGRKIYSLTLHLGFYHYRYYTPSGNNNTTSTVHYYKELKNFLEFFYLKKTTVKDAHLFRCLTIEKRVNLKFSFNMQAVFNYALQSQVVSI
jgi:hypothetical protein